MKSNQALTRNRREINQNYAQKLTNIHVLRALIVIRLLI